MEIFISLNWITSNKEWEWARYSGIFWLKYMLSSLYTVPIIWRGVYEHHVWSADHIINYDKRIL